MSVRASKIPALRWAFCIACVLALGCQDNDRSNSNSAPDVTDGNPCQSNQCRASDQCFDTGDRNPIDPCLICDSTSELTEWSFTAGAQCDDSDPCTEADMCSESVCAGTLVQCNDDNPCTDDICTADAGGCVFQPTTAPCDDSNACTDMDICKDSVCTGTAIECVDDNPCTDDTCQPAKGCVFNTNTLPCDDDDACTTNDTCTELGCLGDVVTCNDNNECTTDSCNDDTGCQFELIVNAACRPNIEVTSPLRAATLQSDDPTVTVSGSVSSAAGNITMFMLNGEEITLDDTGAFTTSVQAKVGGNTLVFTAEDALGTTRQRVQSFLWSTHYFKPQKDQAQSGMITPGLGIFLGQTVLDDTDHSLPPNDIATVLEMIVQSINLNSFVNNPIYDGSTHIAYLENITNSPPKVKLESQQDGLKLQVNMDNIQGKVNADSKCKKVFGACIPLGPGADGKVTISSVVIQAKVTLSVADHALQATVSDVSVSMSKPNIDIDGVVGFLINPILNTFEDDIKNDLESSFQNSIAKSLEPVMEDALSSLAIETTIDLPTLGTDDKVAVDLTSDFLTAEFSDKGCRVTLRVGVYTDNQTPYDNLGMTGRAGCATKAQELVLPSETPLGLSLSDDALNQLLYAGWLGGMLEFQVPISPDELVKYGGTDLAINVSGMLAPTLSDCNGDNELNLHLGDLKATATLEFLGMPVEVVMYVTLTTGMNLYVADGELQFELTEMKSVLTELTVTQDSLVSLEGTLAELIEDSLVPQLKELIESGPIAGIPLPEIDLGSTVDELPEGTAIGFAVEGVSRQDGNTTVTASLK